MALSLATLEIVIFIPIKTSTSNINTNAIFLSVTYHVDIIFLKLAAIFLLLGFFVFLKKLTLNVSTLFEKMLIKFSVKLDISTSTFV